MTAIQKKPKGDEMRFCRTTGLVVLSLISAFFLLYACGGGGGDTTPPPPPTATTSTVNTPSLDNAVINGSVNPNGLATTAWFEYGPDSALSTWTKTADQSVGSGTVSTSINATLLGLSAATTYYYRVAASSTAGTSKGSIVSFSTTGLAPTVTTTAATSITIGGGVLNGTVNPNGLTTTARFEWGIDQNLATLSTTTIQALGSGLTAQSINATLSGLSAGTTYYFRVTASNSVGTSQGTILSFDTSPNPPPVANAGTDNTVFMGHSVTLDGTGSSDGGNGGTITYLWTQLAGTSVTLTGATTANPTFTAPASVVYPSEVLTFRLTVTSSRGPTATDNVNITVKWGFFDDFSTDTTGEYPTTLTGTGAVFNYDSVGKRVRVVTGDDNSVVFSHSLPPSSTGVLSLDFSPTAKYGGHGGIWIRLKLNGNNFYEISNFDYGGSPIETDVAGVRRTTDGGATWVDEVTFATAYNQSSTYNIKITYTPTQVVMEAFGLVIPLSTSGSISVNTLEVETGQQDAYYDNIKLEAAP